MSSRPSCGRSPRTPCGPPRPTWRPPSPPRRPCAARGAARQRPLAACSPRSPPWRSCCRPRPSPSPARATTCSSGSACATSRSGACPRRPRAPALSWRPTSAAASRRAGSSGRSSRPGSPPTIPDELGAPDRVRVMGQRISLVYAPRPSLPELDGIDAGLILTESRGGIPRCLPPEAPARRGRRSSASSVNGAPRRVHLRRRARLPLRDPPAARSARTARCSPGRR